MANSKREEIRKEFKEVIKTAILSLVPTERIFLNRAVKIDERTELPCVIIYTKSDAPEIYTTAPRRYNRKMQLTCEVIARGFESADDVVDEITEKIETAVFRNETLNDKVSDTMLGQTDMDMIEDGSKTVVAARIQFDIEYFVDAPDEQLALDDFQTARTEYEVQPPSAAEKPVDIITLPILP
ncbi:MAG: hypothetical protein BWY19_00802 [bacterium ADurb.Bin212]|nr:MAG: hypothetical protein BWY19_00802 [bacterium ADurb.Bin212]